MAKTTRSGGGGNPYSQPDRKISFFLTTSLRGYPQYLLDQIYQTTKIVHIFKGKSIFMNIFGIHLKFHLRKEGILP